VTEHANDHAAPLIRRDARNKHLDELITKGKGATLHPSSSFQSEGAIKQHNMIGEWQFLRRRSPCVKTHVVLCARVKIPRSSLCETPCENITAGASVLTKVETPSFAGHCERTRRPRHDKSLRESRLQPSLRVDPTLLAFRAVLLGQVPRELQASVGTQQGLLEMALQMS
jgi:hypothetical protein